jgi:hypothetical protein
MADVLSKHPLIAARQYRDRTGTETTQLGDAVGVSQNVDGFELDRTDRKKLFEFQAARSTRLPKDVQCRVALHRIALPRNPLRRRVRCVNRDVEPAAGIEPCRVA